jgi:hypothetical protein
MSRRERATATPILNVNHFWETYSPLSSTTSHNNQKLDNISDNNSVLFSNITFVALSWYFFLINHHRLLPA